MSLAEDPIPNADVPQLSEPSRPQHLPRWSRSHEPSMGQVPPAAGDSHSLELPSGCPSPSSAAGQSAGHHHHGGHLGFCCVLVSTGGPTVPPCREQQRCKEDCGPGEPFVVLAEGVKQHSVLRGSAGEHQHKFCTASYSLLEQASVSRDYLKGPVPHSQTATALLLCTPLPVSALAAACPAYFISDWSSSTLVINCSLFPRNSIGKHCKFMIINKITFSQEAGN